MHGARLHKKSRREAVARDPRRDLLGRDRDILLRDRDETKTLRTLSETRPRRDVSAFRDRLETETSRPRPHPCNRHIKINQMSIDKIRLHEYKSDSSKNQAKLATSGLN